MNKFMLMIFFLFLLVLGYAYVCNDDTRVMKEKIGILKQNKISLPLERMKYICHRSMGENTQINKSLKFVSYSDSMACSSCAVDKLYTWIDLIRKTESYENKLGYYFIFFPKMKEWANVEFVISTLSHFNYPVYMDTLGIFERSNPHLPHNQMFHTFLLDENNNVLLVGNPLDNEKIEEMFWQIVEKKLGKRE